MNIFIYISILNKFPKNTEMAFEKEDSKEEEETKKHVEITDSSPQEIVKSFDLNNLPKTVCKLETDNDSLIYLIGTAHFSRESQQEVRNMIRILEPDIIVLELCSSRLNIIKLDEETILKEASEINFDKLLQATKQLGGANGILYVMLLSLVAHLTKELGQAPGGEFRAAIDESKKLNKCLIHLGDRPINITLKRALASLNLFQTIKFVYMILTSKKSITSEEVERLKDHDLLESMINDLNDEFPTLAEILINERNVYLTNVLQINSKLQIEDADKSRGVKVLGIVGIGHMAGIIDLWPQSQQEKIAKIMTIPEQSLAMTIFKKSLKYSFLFGTGYLTYKIIKNLKIKFF